MILTIRCFLFFCGFVTLAACGGGGGGGGSDSVVNGNGNTTQQPVATLLPSTQSNSLMIAYLSTSNQTKYDNHASTASANTRIYATSVGARVTGNSALVAANSQSFKSEVSTFLNGFITKVGELSLTYAVDANTLNNELSTYQINDVSFITTNIGGKSLDATEINNAYIAAKQRVAQY